MKIFTTHTTLVLLAAAVLALAWPAPAPAGDAWLDANGFVTSATGTQSVTLNGKAVSNGTYWMDPPFLTTKVEPNIMFILDNSGSMNCPAYPGNYKPAKFKSGDYYGYFDPRAMYKYMPIDPLVTDSTGTWVKVTGDPAAVIAAASTVSPVASGNLLNWASMRRLDVTKRLLNGGKADTRTPAAGKTVKLLGADTAGKYCDGDNTVGVFSNAGVIPPSHLPAGYTNVIYPFKANYTYVTGDRGTGGERVSTLSFVPPPGSNPLADPTADALFPASWTKVGTAATAWESLLTGDGNTNYIRTTTLTSPAMFSYQYTGASNATIDRISVAMSASKQTSNRTQRAQGCITVSGTQYCAAEANIGSTSYENYFFDFQVNPATGLAWDWADLMTPSNVGTLEAIGAQLTYNQSATSTFRVSKMYLSITVKDPSGGPYSVVVDTGNTVADTGIIGSLGTGGRFGIAFYNTDNQGAEVKDYVDFGSTTDMLNTIDKVAGETSTPVAESMYTVVKYFRQDTAPYHNNSPTGKYDYIKSAATSSDPYYYRYTTVPGSNLPDQYVACSKSFVLFLTDGEPTADGYPLPSWPAGVTPAPSNDANGFPNVAYWARTKDMRPCPTTAWPCISGDQYIYTYPLFMFGQGSTMLMKAALMGGFEDIPPAGQKFGDNKAACLDNSFNLKPGATQDELKECYRDSNGNGTLDPYSATNLNGDFPLTYYEGDDGYSLQAGIIDAISAMRQRVAAGTSVSVLGSSWKGEGSMYQAYFFPEKQEGLNSIKWTGYFQSLFVDRHGLIHEDSNQDGKLTPDDDLVIQFNFIPGEEIQVNRYYDRVDNATGDLVPDGLIEPAIIDQIKMSGIRPLWDGGKLLALRPASDRSIWTTADADTATLPSLIEFTSANNATLRPYLRAKTVSSAVKLINWVRGEKIAGWRNRDLTVPIGFPTPVDTLVTWKLGDIVFSDPIVVGAPKERFDLIYDDKTYVDFFNRWKNRRNVVYVGANDGMLHAFNAGFFTATETVNPVSSETQVTFTDPLMPLGKELWAFIPQDLLPHLAWMADPDYQHVYGVDGISRITDARIFSDDGPNGTHPGGWGTVLIVCMRLGGGEIDVTDTFGAGSSTKQFKSAYYLLDITDPDVTPTLLWRFTDGELGFTTNMPMLIRETDSIGQDFWYAVFGSGPSNYRGGRAVSNTTTDTKFTKGGVVGALPLVSTMTTSSSYIYVVDLKTGKNDLISWSAHSSSSLKGKIKETQGPGFIAGLTTTDYPLDFKYDMIYAGMTYCRTGCGSDGYGTGWGGKVLRVNTNRLTDPGKWTLSTYITVTQPITAMPSVGLDKRANVWVYFGTGRYLHLDDRFDSAQQYFYGLKDPCYSTGCTTEVTIGSNILSSSTFTVNNADGTISPALGANDLGSGKPSSAITRFDDLANFMQDRGEGWKIRLGPTERVTVNGFVVGGIAGFGSFAPNSDLCEFEGRSKQYFPYYLTGTAPYIPSGSAVSYVSVDTGAGMPSVPAVHIDSAGNVKLFIQKSTGEIFVQKMDQAQTVSGGFGSGGESAD